MDNKAEILFQGFNLWDKVFLFLWEKYLVEGCTLGRQFWRNTAGVKPSVSVILQGLHQLTSRLPLEG